MSNRRFPMIKKTTLAMSIAIALGVFGSSLARANGDGDDHDRYNQWSVTTGPSGQVLGAQPASKGAYAYGFASPVQAQRPASKHSHAR
jgi:hypothetical protein